MSLIRYDLDGGAARIILTAPDRGNPLDPDMAAELFRAVRRARADDARVVVLRSEGRAFSFGGDVGAFATADDREQMVDDLAETLHRTISDLHRMDAVVVSAVQGMAAGAGVPLAAVPGLGGHPPPPWIIALMATPARYYSRTYLRIVAPIVFGSDPAVADAASGAARLRRPPSLIGYSHQLYAISGWSSRRWLHRLDLPVLVLTGSRDPLVPQRNGVILTRSIPGAQLQVVDGGHLFLPEQPEQGGQAISAFLDEQDRTDAELS